MIEGAGMMAVSYRGHLEGRFLGWSQWADTARAGEAIGMSPAQYAVLRDDLRGLDPARYPGHPAHRYGRDESGYRQQPVDLAEWAEWVALVAAGHRPSHATQKVLQRLAGEEENGS